MESDDHGLVVTIEEVLYPITDQVIHQVFDSYGKFEILDVFSLRNGDIQAFIWFQYSWSVMAAKISLQGRSIYSGCCHMEIESYNQNVSTLASSTHADVVFDEMSERADENFREHKGSEKGKDVTSHVAEGQTLMFEDLDKGKSQEESKYFWGTEMGNSHVEINNKSSAVSVSTETLHSEVKELEKPNHELVKEAGLKLYTTLIASCAKSGKVDAMLEVFHEMVNAEVKPNLHAYGARNDSLVRDYDVSDRGVLNLVLRRSDFQAINVKTASGNEFNFHVEKSRDVAYVKQQIAEKKELIDMEDQEILFDGEKLEDQRRIQEICKGDDAVIHLLVQKSAKVRARPIEKNFALSIVASDLNGKRNYEFDGESIFGKGSVDDFIMRKPPEKEYYLEPVIVNPKIELLKAINDLIKSSFEGLDGGNYSTRYSEGTGGAYFMKDSLGNKHVSVFKPIDEEPCAVNNPRGLPMSTDGEGLKRGTIVGEGALREVAACILDHPRTGIGTTRIK